MDPGLPPPPEETVENLCLEHDEIAEKQRLQKAWAEEVDLHKEEIEKSTEHLREELKQNISQFHELFELMERVELMLKDIEKPFSITKENQRLLKTHHGSEVGRDIVEQALIREADILRRSHKLIGKELRRISRQLALLREIRLQIENHIKNQTEVNDTVTCFKILSTLSQEIGQVEIPAPHLPLGTSPVIWIQDAEHLIEKSQLERNVAQFLSIDVTKEMLTVANECFGIWYTTNSAFKKRNTVLMEAKKEVQRHLNKLEQDMATLKGNLDEVENAIASKSSFLQIAQNRLEERKGVPGIELCRDPEMMELFKEIQVLRNIIEILTPKRLEMESMMDQLHKTKNKLERDLKLKSMQIGYKEKCLYLRQSCPISTFQEARSARLFSAFMEN